jgi:hypothetical protein
MDYFTGGMAETVEHLLCKLKALFHQKKKKKKKRKPISNNAMFIDP